MPRPGHVELDLAIGLLDNFYTAGLGRPERRDLGNYLSRVEGVSSADQRRRIIDMAEGFAGERGQIQPREGRTAAEIAQEIIKPAGVRLDIEYDFVTPEKTVGPIKVKAEAWESWAELDAKLKEIAEVIEISE